VIKILIILMMLRVSITVIMHNDSHDYHLTAEKVNENWCRLTDRYVRYSTVICKQKEESFYWPQCSTWLCSWFGKRVSILLLQLFVSIFQIIFVYCNLIYISYNIIRLNLQYLKRIIELYRNSELLFYDLRMV